MTEPHPAPEMRIDGAALQAFMLDWSFVTVIRGPWASGKSTACIGKLFQAANWQAPDRRGVRRSRWAVVRGSYPELQETTVKSWLDWFPEDVYGPMRRSRPFGHIIRCNGAPEGVRSPNSIVRSNPTQVEMENIFLALDDENDLKKLLSLELTGGWVNEARELIKPLIDALIGRTGRYPAKRDGGHTWAGVVMDTNAPAENHWLPMMMGESPIPDTISEDERMGLKCPDDWRYFVQPGALQPVKDEVGKIVDFEPNPLAENINNLTDGFDYYMKRKGGKTRSWVMVNFCNELGVLMAGKPVWPTFERLKHVSRATLAYDPNFPLLIGIDSTGRNPSAVFGQNIRGRWRILAELVGRDIAVPMFARQVKALAGRIVSTAGLSYAQASIIFYRDPHQEKGQGDDRNTDQMYIQEGIRLIPAPGGNAISTRTQTVEVLFDNDRIEIDPRCVTLISACSGGYRFRKLRLSGVEAYEDIPDKTNGFADVADALQYLCLGGGAGREMVSGGVRPKPVNVIRKFSPMQRGPVERTRASLFAR